MASLAELASLLGLGGVLGGLIALYAAGKKFADHLSRLAATVDAVLKDPARADLKKLAEDARIVEQDARSLIGMLKQVFKG